MDELKWIPTTEQTPPPYKKVLLTVKVPRWSREKGYYEDNEVVCKACNKENPNEHGILAWMPLPEPYREDTK